MPGASWRPDQAAPDGVLLMRTSSRKKFRRCPWAWWQTYVEGWSPRRQPTWSVFGNAWHRAMQTWYPEGRKRGDLEETIDSFLDFLEDEIRRVMVEDDTGEDGELTYAHELGPAMLEGYVQHYGNDSEWEVVHTEQPFQIDVPHPENQDKIIAVYLGTWDLLAWHRKRKRYWLWDHKTAKRLPETRMLDLDDQGGSYLWVAKEVLVHKGVLTKRESIEGIVFNYARKALPDPRAVNRHGEALNKNGTVSKRQPSPRFLRHPAYRSPHAKYAQALRVRQEAEAMSLMLAGKLPVWKNTTEDCPRCPLFEMCDLHEQGEDWEDYRDQLFVRRDPYADHREEMAREGIVLSNR